MSSINSSEDKDGKVETSGNDSSMSGKKPLGGESPKIGQSLETMMSFIVVLADWLRFSGKFLFSSGLERPFQLPCYNSACEGKAVDTDEFQEILKGLNSNYEYRRPSLTEIFCYAIPRYPDNHNPLLPLALQKKLDAMAPREFLTYVLNELTLEERESLMVDERQRRKSFLVNWPHSNNLSGVKLAQAGFYCADNYDRVQCVFCRGSLHHWERDDNPVTEHARSFNFCRFVKGLECGNREYKSDVLTADELKNINFFGTPPEMKKNRDGSVSIDLRSLGISTNTADTIQYAPEASRLRTYARWPASSPVTARTLCEAGFYFTGFDDQVRCFFCSGGVRDWRNGDDPWEEHARWFPDCAFLEHQQGKQYILDVHACTPANKKFRRTASFSESLKVATETQDMIGLCLKLGHEQEIIDRAFEENGAPFEDISSLIDKLCALEEGESAMVEDRGDNQLTGSGVLVAHAAGETAADSAGFMPGRMDGHRSFPDSEVACIMCYRKTEQNIAATHVGLPCGHLILCSTCSDDQERQVLSNLAHKPVCPFRNCGGTLAGTQRSSGPDPRPDPRP